MCIRDRDTVVPAYDTELNAFLTLPYSKLAESLLQQENIFHEDVYKRQGLD